MKIKFNDAIETACSVFGKYHDVRKYDPFFVTHTIVQLTERILADKPVELNGKLYCPYDPEIRVSDHWRDYIREFVQRKYKLTFAM